MSQERSSQDKSGKTEAKGFSKDIVPLLKGWDYEPGTINVRKISGIDGAPKLQMRLDLGLLQMEMTGRPDGVRPPARLDVNREPSSPVAGLPCYR